MLDKIKKYISDEKMISYGDRIVVGVSGGADSLCLLHILLQLKQEYGLELHCVHVNHGLRGDAADADEQLTAEFCRMNGVEFNPVHINVHELADEKKIGCEEAGRLARYDAFYSAAGTFSCNKIAIAHHMDDNAETVLFQLARGSGIAGLKGISSQRLQHIDTEGRLVNIIRPLLCVTRDEIEEYMNHEGILYAVDATNLTEDFSRNVIRHSILPIMKERLNTRVVEHISACAGQLGEIDEFLEECTEAVYTDIVGRDKANSANVRLISLEKLEKQHRVIIMRVLRCAVSELAGGIKDITSNHIEMLFTLCSMQTGRRMSLPYGITAERTYSELRLTVNMEDGQPDENNDIEVSFDEKDLPTVINLSENDLKLALKIVKYDKNSNIPKNKCTKWFSYDKIFDTFTVRTPRSGDFIKINKHGGTKLLKDYLCDIKLDRSCRDKVTVLAAGNEILWVIGWRSSEGYLVDDNTERVLVAELIQK